MLAKRKIKIYVAIFILWLITCGVLYYFDLINWIGIAVSFLFAIPPIIIDLVSSIKQEKRAKQLESIAKIQKFLKHLNDMQADIIRCNLENKRAGHLERVCDIDKVIQEAINNTNNSTFYRKHLSVVFGKDRENELYLKMLKERDYINKVLNDKIILFNPNENECKYYNLVIDDSLGKELFFKQNQEQIDGYKK